MESAEDEVRGGSAAFLALVRRHPVRAGLLSVGFLFLLDLALLPIPTLLSYRTAQPGLTAFQNADRERQAGKGAMPTIRKQWVAYRSIPKHLVRAVLVSEDASFWQHSGFDTFEIHRSISEAMSDGKDLRGASTITQQLVKNLFLSPSRNPMRKYHEVLLTIIAERSLGKRRILELYLNEIEWGKGIYGAEAASRHHFGKGVADISAREAAFLAAIIPSPTRYTPATATDYIDRKVRRILRLMGMPEKPATAPEHPDQAAQADTLGPSIEMNDSLRTVPE